jgi:hypothetical protein
MLLTLTCEGKKHDKKIADETNLVLPDGSSLCQDTGFQGFALTNVTMIQPKKKPRGKELTPEEKESNRQIPACVSGLSMLLGESNAIGLLKINCEIGRMTFEIGSWKLAAACTISA